LKLTLDGLAFSANKASSVRFGRAQNQRTIVRARRASNSSDVRFWHKADMLNALTNVPFGSKPDTDQPLLANLDL
jgi:hypothetical protein